MPSLSTASWTTRAGSLSAFALGKGERTEREPIDRGIGFAGVGTPGEASYSTGRANPYSYWWNYSSTWGGLNKLVFPSYGWSPRRTTTATDRRATIVYKQRFRLLNDVPSPTDGRLGAASAAEGFATVVPTRRNPMPRFRAPGSGTVFALSESKGRQDPRASSSSPSIKTHRQRHDVQQDGPVRTYPISMPPSIKENERVRLHDRQIAQRRSSFETGIYNLTQQQRDPRFTAKAAEGNVLLAATRATQRRHSPLQLLAHQPRSALAPRPGDAPFTIPR